MDNPIGEWLRETRLRQVMPGTRKPWSQDYLLDRMQEAIAWAPHRPNYSKYENGKAKPEPDTLDKFIAFWTARGEPGPDLSPKEVAEPPVDPLVAALNRQAAAIEQLVARFDQLASAAIREGVADALREAGVDPSDGGSLASRPDGRTA